MYVIFRAQDVLDFYSSTSTTTTSWSQRYKKASQLTTNMSSLLPSTGQSQSSSQPNSSYSELSLRDFTHPAISEDLKSHNALTFKLVKTVSDFTQQLATIHEQHAEELQLLVENFRKRNAELRKERPLYQSTLFNMWETFLQEVEVDSQVHSDIASIVGRHVSIALLERTFHRKVQSRKIFLHRESFETILSKTEELLFKCHKEYTKAYEMMVIDRRSSTIEAYTDAHNVYVQQLHAANAMIDEYHRETLPQLLEEMEEVYLLLSNTVSQAILEGTEVISAKAREQNGRYEALCSFSKTVNGKGDLVNFLKTLSLDRAPADGLKHEFMLPRLEVVEGSEVPDMSNVPILRNEVIIDKSLLVPMRSKYDSLRKEAAELEMKIRGLQEALESLIRLQQRSVESSLYNKANEIQEDMGMKRFDLRTAQIHVAAVKAQISLLGAVLEDGKQDTSRDRKMSSTSTGSIKSKWLKAFKSLKTGPSEKKPEKKEAVKDGKNGESSSAETVHIFQEYTYKKITPCDVCHEILRGHTRQGIRCKMCKLNVHPDCQEKAAKCQPKPRLLRRQKSTSEIETRVMTEKDDERSGDCQARPKVESPPSSTSPSFFPDGFFLRRRSYGTSKSVSLESSQSAESNGAKSASPHSPRRQKLNLRMKSLSLDSPESNEHVQRRRHQAHPSQNSSHSQSPQSPVHTRRLLNTKTVRMSSVDLPDDNEKSLSSASTSPCPSPKPHRLLPTNLYVVLYNFKSRQQDELNLNAGYTVTVIDTSDPDWWKGKCLGKVGYFPSKYVAKLNPGEKPLQVTHNLQVNGGENGLKLLRDQIVIQVGEGTDGMVPIRLGDKQGTCPLKYLQEV